MFNKENLELKELLEIFSMVDVAPREIFHWKAIFSEGKMSLQEMLGEILPEAAG